MTADAQYADILADILAVGSAVTTRNATCRRLFARVCRFDRTPLVTARRTAWKTALREMEFFLSGNGDDIGFAHPSVRPWWEPWADEYGEIPNNYGAALRGPSGYVGFDQIKYLVDGVAGHPFSRRNVVTTWDTEKMAAPETPITNCWGTVIQAFVEPDDSLHLVTYQRSADVVCGLPHNWIQMWAFLLWLARRGGRAPGTLTWVGGDVHVYPQHDDLARRIVAAAPSCSPPPELVYVPTSDDFRADDFTLGGPYTPAIDERAEMVV